MGRCAQWGLCNLSLVSRGASAGSGRSLDVSATPADVQPCHNRLALAWDGVEGARFLVRSHLDHYGRVQSSSGMATILRIIANFGRRCWSLAWLPLLLRGSQVSSVRRSTTTHRFKAATQSN